MPAQHRCPPPPTRTPLPPPEESGVRRVRALNTDVTFIHSLTPPIPPPPHPLQESGVRHWRRVPALNTDVTFIDDLADAVIEALPYVGRFGGHSSSTLASSDASVPIGDLEALLGAYDRERRALPAPVGPWEWGFTKSAETWNGRIAMVAIIVILLLEVTTGQSILYNMIAID